MNNSEHAALLEEVRGAVFDAVREKVDPKALTGDALAATEAPLRAHIREALKKRAEEKILPLDEKQLVETADGIYREVTGLGPMEQFLQDGDVSEVMVNGTESIYVERHGQIVETQRRYRSDREILEAVRKILAPLGRRIDDEVPYVDARLPDGSRVHAIIRPLSIKGPLVTIRKFFKTRIGPQDLIRFGTVTDDAVTFIDACVKARLNIVVAGGTGTGKTTMLNILSSMIPETDRIVTIEDAAELALHQRHVLPLEARPPGPDGRGEITIRDLVRNALRMRPDRLIIGECRQSEALDMLQAMNTGHNGSMTTVHANTPHDALSRIETMTLMSGIELPLPAIRRQIQSALHLIIQMARYPDGSRKISHVTEVHGMEGDVITRQDLFVYKIERVAPDGKVKGKFMPQGVVPRFMDMFAPLGIQLPKGIFGRT